MLNILSAIYVAIAATMISNDADSIAQYAAAKEKAQAQTEAVQVDMIVSQIEDEYDDLWMN